MDQNPRSNPRVAQPLSGATRPPFQAAALAAAMHFLACSIYALLIALALSADSAAAAKTHVISFGKWTQVEWNATFDDKPVLMRVRPLLIDARVKEFVTGPPHEITERIFVVRRVFRLNDGLPDDATPKWQSQRGGWLRVDRVTGHITPINLPEFDPLYSAASWYRDYVAYCGISDDGKKTDAIVAQLSRRKPVLKKPIADGVPDDAPADSDCPAPTWQRRPTRVSFEPGSAAKQTFAIRGHVVDLVDDDDEDEP